MSYTLERANLDETMTNNIRALEQDLQCRIVALQPKIPYANLSRDQLAKLQSMERELGVSLVAYEAIDHYRIANLPGHELQRMQQLEKDTGLFMVAYQHISEDPVAQSFRPEGYKVANLTENQSKRLQQAERETSSLLVAYKNS
jgi:hypothetical protein